MFNNSGVPYNDYVGDGDGVYNQDRPPPQETSFGVIDRPCFQPAQEFEPCRHGFDRLPVRQGSQLIGVSRLGLAQRYLQHALLHPVSATGRLDDIIPFGHDQYNATTIRPEHDQYDPAFARAPEHASSRAYNTPLRLEARLPITGTDTPAPWNPHHAALDVPGASMYHEALQAPWCEDHCAARPTQQVIELAGQSTPGADFGDTLDYSMSVSSEFPFACATCPMPFEAESSNNELATQLPAPQLPCTRPEPAAACIHLGTPMRSLDFAASHSLGAAMPQLVRRPLEANILNTYVRSDDQTYAAVARPSSRTGLGRASTVALPSHLNVTRNNNERCCDQESWPREVVSASLQIPPVIVKEGTRYQPTRATKKYLEAWAEALGCSLENICPIYSGRRVPCRMRGCSGSDHGCNRVFDVVSRKHELQDHVREFLDSVFKNRRERRVCPWVGCTKMKNRNDMHHHLTRARDHFRAEEVECPFVGCMSVANQPNGYTTHLRQTCRNESVVRARARLA